MAKENTPNGENTPTTTTSRAATATIGGAAIVATGEPTKWLWNDMLTWVVGGMKGTLPAMPDPVAAFFGALLLAAVYGVVRAVRSRAS